LRADPSSWEAPTGSRRLPLRPRLVTSPFGGRYVAELLTLAEKAFRAGEREANTGRSADPARRRFEAKAKQLRFGVKWPGLLPSLTRAGRDIYLPEV
jgi:hypothetical protein